MIQINILGTNSIITGEYPFDALRKELSWAVEGAQYSKAYKRGLWDGRKHLLKTNGAFPTGLLTTVLNYLNKVSLEYEVVDTRELPVSSEPGSYELADISFDYPYDYQLDAAKTMVEKKQGIVRIATNGGKTAIACSVTQFLGLKTLFIVQNLELLYQAQSYFSTKLGVPLDTIGLIGDNIWEPKDITIATLATLDSRLSNQYCLDFLETIEVLFIDECHHMGSDTWYNVSTLCNAYYRFGLSGTPLDRTDGANLRLIAATGDVLVNIDNQFLVDRGISARAHIIFDKVTQPMLERKVTYAQAYSTGVVENEVVTQKVVDWVKVCFNQDLSVLVLVEQIKHGNLIDEALWTKVGDVFIPHQFINGKEDSDTRRSALADFGSRDLPVLVASTILDEGVDVPTIDVLICAGSRKSHIRTMQRLGRGLRGKQLIVIEFVNFCNDYLLKHSQARYNAYKNEACFVLHQSAPNEHLIKKLWTKA